MLVFGSILGQLEQARPVVYIGAQRIGNRSPRMWFFIGFCIGGEARPITKTICVQCPPPNPRKHFNLFEALCRLFRLQNLIQYRGCSSVLFVIYIGNISVHVPMAAWKIYAHRLLYTAWRMSNINSPWLNREADMLYCQCSISYVCEISPIMLEHRYRVFSLWLIYIA